MCISLSDIYVYVSGFPQRLENLENENGHGKVMEHAKLAKRHGILPILPPNCTKLACFFAATEKICIRVAGLHLPMFSAKCREFKIEKRYGHGKVMEKYYHVGALSLGPQ